MAEKYKRQPKYAFAGIRYLLATARDEIMIGALVSDNYSDNDALSLAAEWLGNCYNQFDQRLLKEYQYQLYPTYLEMLRTLMLLNGGKELKDDKDLLSQIKKMEDFMHFKLKVEFEATGHDNNNGKWHAFVTGETEIQCKLEEGGCYVWEAVNGNNMQFQVIDVVFTSNEGVVVYKGPPTFTTPIIIRVNMCAGEPKFKIAFSSFGSPDETYMGDGSEGQSPVLYGLASATLGSANVQRMQNELNILKQKTAKWQGREEEIDAANKRLTEHQNDPSYKNSAQGKADMALIRQVAESMGYDLNNPSQKQRDNVNNLKAANAKQREINSKLSQPGYIRSEAYLKDQQDLATLREKTDMASLTESVGFDINMLEIEAPFLIGNKKVIDKIQKDKIQEVAGSKGGWDYGQFHITLENTPAKN